MILSIVCFIWRVLWRIFVWAFIFWMQWCGLKWQAWVSSSFQKQKGLGTSKSHVASFRHFALGILWSLEREKVIFRYWPGLWKLFSVGIENLAVHRLLKIDVQMSGASQTHMATEAMDHNLVPWWTAKGRGRWNSYVFPTNGDIGFTMLGPSSSIMGLEMEDAPKVPLGKNWVPMDTYLTFLCDGWCPISDELIKLGWGMTDRGKFGDMAIIF